jgi:sugar phosphate isomerase/epimerase
MAFPVTFMTANFVARQTGFRYAEWGEGDRATNAWYAPLDTYPDRFDELLRAVATFDVDGIDIWTSHLNPDWATDEHVEIATGLLASYGLRVASYAGWYGATPEAFERSCTIAVALGRPILGGATGAWKADRSAVLDILERHDLRLAFENHPAERTPEDMLTLIGDAPARVGTAVDTGWWATQDYDAARAIEELGDRVLHVHLKDVREAGAHRTCRLGDGVVPIERCIRALEAIAYGGDLSIEHEPEEYDPSDEIRDGIALVRRLQAARA